MASVWPTQGPAPRARADATPAAPAAQARTLYCEFNNFADLTPLVGFYFRIDGAPSSPSYALIYRRDQDGSRSDATGADAASAPWIFEGARDPALLRSPDDETTINLYGDPAARPGSAWFEAGLRSIRYRNLGGRCRHGA